MHHKQGGGEPKANLIGHVIRINVILPNNLIQVDKIMINFLDKLMNETFAVLVSSLFILILASGT